MRKKIVMYFHRRPLGNDPFSTFTNKRTVYHQFFKQGVSAGFQMFIASGKENYEEPSTFKDAYEYVDGSFTPYGTISADAVFDRSGGLSFPRENNDINVLNTIAFKRLCNDKNAMYALLSDYMPKNYTVRDATELEAATKTFDDRETVVLKPAKGMQGKGIIIGPATELRATALEPGQEYSLQEFVDTSMGIPGVVKTRHDLRVIIVDGEIVLCHVRIPKEGSLLANVAQGGSIREVPISDIPAFIIERVFMIQRRIDVLFDFPLYSIDFGIQDGKTPYVFELNDQIGFPSEEMDSELFIERILRSLGKRASLHT